MRPPRKILPFAIRNLKACFHSSERTDRQPRLQSKLRQCPGTLPNRNDARLADPTHIRELVRRVPSIGHHPVYPCDIRKSRESASERLLLWADSTASQSPNQPVSFPQSLSCA